MRLLLYKLFSGQLDGGIRNIIADPDAVPVHIVKYRTNGDCSALLFGSEQDSD